jgi:glycerol-3-phosphate dehydrogenase
MWEKDWRARVWTGLDGSWDILIIGGGITGAGLLREASRAGLRTLLLEGQDFASGTSSRSSKMVHGGFRYLSNAQIMTTLQCVRERERLLKEGRGLVYPLGFLLANYCDDSLPGWMCGAGLIFYDLLALKWGHRRYDSYDIKELCPSLNETGLQGGYRYFDAITDDARLVLRLIREAVRSGGQALNYARVTGLLRTKTGQVCGVVVRDEAPPAAGRTLEIQAKVVINATGAWADDLRLEIGGRTRLRKLRGSHLVFPASRLPLTRSVCIQHPRDRRFVFAFPWEGVTLLGTTDLDHTQPLDQEPSISSQEVDYLLTAAQESFCSQELQIEDVQATFSGVRPVVGTGKANPSKESREHILWSENGLLTVAGGKLTTFRLMALDALKAALSRLPGKPRFNYDSRVLDLPPAEELLEAASKPAAGLKPYARTRLLGRFGSDAPDVLACAAPGELSPVEGTSSLWAELRWAARSEGVVHLDDLLLRRVRLGLLLPQGGLPLLESIRRIVQPELGWDEARWEREAVEYARRWQASYSLPG